MTICGVASNNIPDNFALHCIVADTCVFCSFTICGCSDQEANSKHCDRQDCPGTYQQQSGIEVVEDENVLFINCLNVLKVVILLVVINIRGAVMAARVKAKASLA